MNTPEEKKADCHPSSSDEQRLLAEIEIAQKGLYLFKGSNAKKEWEDLLNEARKEAQCGNYIEAWKLVGRVKEVNDNLAKRRYHWFDTQTKITSAAILLILVELSVIVWYVYGTNFDVSEYPLYTSILFGLLGGTLGMMLSTEMLDIEGSDRLHMLRQARRPFVGAVAAVIMYALLQARVIIVAPEIDSGAVLILLSIFAGFSERFITKAFDQYIPSMIPEGGADEKAKKEDAS